MSNLNMNAITNNAEAIGSKTYHWVGDSIGWSPKNGGCLMWTRNGEDWSSQDEGEYPTPADAEDALGWYERQGVWVNWASLDDHAVVHIEAAS